MTPATDPGYRLHCWHGREHSHASRDEARDCINRHQPGSPDARRCGCDCRPGHIHLACPLHSPTRSRYQ